MNGMNMQTVNLVLSEYYNFDGELVVYASVRKNFQTSSGQTVQEEIDFLKFKDLNPAEYGTVFFNKHYLKGKSGREQGVILHSGDQYALVKFGKRINFLSGKGSILAGELVSYGKGEITIALSENDFRTFDHKSFRAINLGSSSVGKKKVVI